MSDHDVTARPNSTAVSTDLKSIADRAAVFAKAGKSAATKKAYRADFQHFSEWCVGHDLSPLPAEPEAVAFYITHLADSDFACSTIARRMVAISQAHKLTGHDVPTTESVVREVWKGIRRAQGTAQRSKRPLLTVEIRRIVQQLGDRLIDLRDKALLLVGFAGGLRRSELVGLHVEDIEDRERGLVLHIRRSKTDQEKHGQKVGVPRGTNPETCPVRALMVWLQKAGIDEGPLFRSVSKGEELADTALSGYAVSLVIKEHVEAIGLNPDRYSAHSLRSGFATEAARGGALEREIMRQTRHRSREVVRRYIKAGSIFRGNAAEKLGL